MGPGEVAEEPGALEVDLLEAPVRVLEGPRGEEGLHDRVVLRPDDVLEEALELLLGGGEEGAGGFPEAGGGGGGEGGRRRGW